MDTDAAMVSRTINNNFVRKLMVWLRGMARAADGLEFLQSSRCRIVRGWTLGHQARHQRDAIHPSAQASNREHSGQDQHIPVRQPAAARGDLPAIFSREHRAAPD